jgi:hypothetical protein
VDDDIGTPGDRLAEERTGQSVVDDEGDTGLVGDGGDRLDVDDEAAGIGRALDEDRLAFLRQRAREVLGIVRIDENGFPAKFFERLAELGDRAAIELLRGEELVAGLHEGEEGEHLCGVAGGASRRPAAILEAGNFLLEGRDRRVGEARINIAERRQVEQRSSVIGVVEDVGGGLIDRRDAGAGRRIGRRARVDGARFESGIEAPVVNLGRCCG